MKRFDLFGGGATVYAPVVMDLPLQRFWLHWALSVLLLQ